MVHTRLGWRRSIASALFGAGCFGVIYPLLVLVLAPIRVFSTRHQVFLAVGLVCLAGAALLVRTSRGADRER